MTVKIDVKKCIYCGGCTAVCPFNALDLKETKIEVNNKACTNCNICVKFCPVEAIKLVKK